MSFCEKEYFFFGTANPTLGTMTNNKCETNYIKKDNKCMPTVYEFKQNGDSCAKGYDKKNVDEGKKDAKTYYQCVHQKYEKETNDTCAQGYVPVNNTCVPCKNNTYKLNSKDTKCTGCPDGKKTTYNKHAQYKKDHCYAADCKPAYEINNGECIERKK